MSFWTPPNIPGMPTWDDIPTISINQKQGFTDFRYTVDQLMNVSNSLLKDVMKWYHQDRDNRKDKAQQYLTWKQGFIAFAQSIEESPLVAPTDEIVASIDAYKDELKEYIKSFKDAKVPIRPLVVPGTRKEEEGSPFWRFVKIAGYTALGISAVYAGTEFIKVLKDGGNDNE